MRASLSRKTVLVLASLLALGCQPGGSEMDDVIVPGERVGPVTRDASEMELIRRFDDDAQPEQIPLGEGETAPGMILFPHDPQRRLSIVWRDRTEKRFPERVRIEGSRSVWRLPEGIGLGMTLSELERKNGGPFELAGFGWDYSGIVTSWRGRRLEGRLPGVRIYLDVAPSQRGTPAYDRVLGDRGYASDGPEMRELNPRVYAIFVDFE